jgi:hypothetical protein
MIVIDGGADVQRFGHVEVGGFCGVCGCAWPCWAGVRRAEETSTGRAAAGTSSWSAAPGVRW